MGMHVVNVGKKIEVRIDDSLDREKERARIIAEATKRGEKPDDLTISIDMFGVSGMAKEGFLDRHDSVQIKIGRKTYDVNPGEFIEFLMRAGNGSTRQPDQFDRFIIEEAMDRISLIPEEDLVAFVEGRVQYTVDDIPREGSLRTDQFYTYHVVDKKDMAPDGTVKTGRIGGFHPGSSRFAPKSPLIKTGK